MSLAYFWILVFLMAAGAPVVFALLLAPGLSLALDGRPEFFSTLLVRLYSGIDSFPLMAVPFFVLAGEIMNAGGITRRIVDFAGTLIGHFRGGLAHVNILSSLMFSGLSGSAVADASAVGKMLIPVMEANGYTRRFAAAVTAASAVIGPIIPPSGIMILYAFVMGVPVAALFAGGVLPGLLICLALMAVTALLARRLNLPRAGAKAGWNERGAAFAKAIPALLTPAILLGGIWFGVFTPTEAAAVAVAYALIVSLFVTRTLRLSDLPGVLQSAAIQSGVILFLVGAAVTFAWIITVSGLGGAVGDSFGALSDNVFVLLFLVNLFLFLIGMVLDVGPAILILAPVLAPIFTNLGVDPVHFGIIMCINLSIGLATPPMGLVLFVAAGLSGERTERIALAMLPYLAAQIGIIFLITFVPEIPLFLPRLLGLL